MRMAPHKSRSFGGWGPVGVVTFEIFQDFSTRRLEISARIAAADPASRRASSQPSNLPASAACRV